MKSTTDKCCMLQDAHRNARAHTHTRTQKQGETHTHTLLDMGKVNYHDWTMEGSLQSLQARHRHKHESRTQGSTSTWDTRMHTFCSNQNLSDGSLLMPCLKLGIMPSGPLPTRTHGTIGSTNCGVTFFQMVLSNLWICSSTFGGTISTQSDPTRQSEE